MVLDNDILSGKGKGRGMRRGRGRGKRRGRGRGRGRFNSLEQLTASALMQLLAWCCNTPPCFPKYPQHVCTYQSLSWLKCCSFCPTRSIHSINLNSIGNLGRKPKLLFRNQAPKNGIWRTAHLKPTSLNFSHQPRVILMTQQKQWPNSMMPGML